MNLPPIPATVIGSWSFPGWYDRFCAEAATPGLYGPQDKAEAAEDATRLAIDDQVRAGIDLITDGEMSRVDFNLGFYDFITNIEPLPAGRKFGPPAHDQRSKYRCTGRLAAAKGLGCKEEWERLRRLTAHPAKMPVPGPFTLAGCIDGAGVYKDRLAVTQALIPIVNRELRTLQDAGCGYLQLDEPSFACRPDKPEEFLDIIAATVEGVRVPVSMHMCFGNFRARATGHRSYAPLFPHVGRAKVTQLAMEFASREMAEVELLARLPETMEVAVGLVDVKNSWVEPAALVADRLKQVIRHVGAARVSVTPDCGFSQTARHVTVAKAAAMVEGVRMVRKSLPGGQA